MPARGNQCRAAGDELAGQYPPAAQRDRARADPGRRDRADPASELESQNGSAGTSEALALGPQITSLALREARELFEREYLLAQINRFGGNISRTAQFVGMERSALHRKLKSLGVVGGMRVEEEMMGK